MPLRTANMPAEPATAEPAARATTCPVPGSTSSSVVPWVRSNRFPAESVPSGTTPASDQSRSPVSPS
jgi:hypothetical protein